jgi:ketosteroid isomerase-like protein
MSQENVEIVRATGEAVQRGDWDAAMSIYAPDVPSHDRTRASDRGRGVHADCRRLHLPWWQGR